MNSNIITHYKLDVMGGPFVSSDLANPVFRQNAFVTAGARQKLTFPGCLIVLLRLLNANLVQAAP